MAAGKPVYVSQRAFDRMNEWLLDDAQWQAPEQNNKEMYLKQCGLLLFAHYRRQLSLFCIGWRTAIPEQCPRRSLKRLTASSAAVPGRARVRFVAARGDRPRACRFFGNAQPSFARKDG